MNILVACECSGTVRDAFILAGHSAMSCDLKASEASGPHYQGDVFDVISDQRWDLVIAHPPCTYLSVSGIHWNFRRPGRAALTEEAVKFFLRLWESCKAPYRAFENPVGIIATRWRKPDQIIQPYEFGDDASKKTCLWLMGLPKLQSTIRCPGRLVQYRGKTVERWSNQTDSGQNRLGPSEGRAAARAVTYPGVARAMAIQWGQLKPIPISCI